MARRRIAILSARPLGVPSCDVCLRPTPRAKRIEGEVSHCGACYKLRFPSRVCASCGSRCRAPASDAVPKCRTCRDGARHCVRCGRPAPRAGRVVTEGVHCASCAYHSAPKRTCSACGWLAPRLSRLGGAGDPVCDRCRRAAACSTCARCRRHRRPAGADRDDRPLCGPCLAGVSHPCPDCNAQIPGGGRAPCASCSARRRGRFQAGVRRSALIEPWTVSLFDAFCASVLLAGTPNGAIVRQVDAAADFFVALGSTFLNRSDVNAAQLRGALGAERLRRWERVVTFLSGELRLSWGGVEEPPRRAVDGVRALGADPDPIQALKAAHGRHLDRLRSEGALSSRTVGRYGRAAEALLSFTAREKRAEPTHQDVRRLLWAKPGLRASLGPFLSWLDVERGIAVAMPHRAPRNAKAAELRLIDDFTSLMGRLEAGCPAPEHRALLAAAIARALGIPLEAVLRLRSTDFAGEGFSVLVHGDGEITLPARLRAQCEKLTGGATDFLFPGRSGLRPASPSSVFHHRRGSAGARRSRSSTDSCEAT